MQKIMSLAKRRGFIFQGSEIYGGLGGTWDYGPLGAELKNNIKKEYLKEMVYQRNDTYLIDAAILMNPRVWVASGHTESFFDPLTECKICHIRIRADHESEKKNHNEFHNKKGESPLWTEAKQFNLLVEAKLGAVEGEKDTIFLRGEITQGAHVNFKNILDSMHPKIPFGAVQIGKAFRNEITPQNFTFRSREFEQMETQFYIMPEEKESEKWFNYFKELRFNWYVNLGIKKENLRFRQHKQDEMAHYAKDALDIEYNSPWGGFKEFEGIHHRGSWDLSRHTEYSKQDLSYYDEESKERFIPWVIETSGGVDRACLFLLIDAYTEDVLNNETRVVLKLNPKLSPFKAAVFPLLANKPNLVNTAREIFTELKKHLNIAWDDIGNIGKRYRRQDEIGTPWCATIDFQTLEDRTVTLRDRDTAEQIRIDKSGLLEYFNNRL